MIREKQPLRARGAVAILVAVFLGACSSEKTSKDLTPAKQQQSNAEVAPAKQQPAKTAVPGRTLYALAANTPVYERASLESGKIVTVNQGHELVEISRAGDWIEVGVARTGLIGWVPRESISQTSPGGQTATPPTPEFKRFHQAFEALNKRIRDATGVALFTGAEDMGDGIVQVTATDTWLSGSREERESNLATIYSMWSAANGDRSLPVFVNVVDAQGRLRASYPRNR